MTWDQFITTTGQAYGTTSPQVELTRGILGILGGNGDEEDGEIGLSDKTLWFNDASLCLVKFDN